MASDDDSEQQKSLNNLPADVLALIHSILRGPAKMADDAFELSEPGHMEKQRTVRRGGDQSLRSPASASHV